MIEFIQKGGVLMWLLLVCSGVSVAVIVERLLYFHRITIAAGDFLKGIANAVRRKQYSEAQLECQSTPGPVPKVIVAILLGRNNDRMTLKAIAQEAEQLEVQDLEKHLCILAAIAQLSPLIGVLGTVIGIMQAFATISASHHGVGMELLSHKIYISLLTTVAGLGVAIPSRVGFQYLSSRVNKFVKEMERAGIEMIHLLFQQHTLDVENFLEK